jgi:predicted neuraminidase
MVVRTKPVVMDNGEVIFGVENDDGYSRFWITADCGQSWQITGPVTGVMNLHPTIVQRQDGSLLAYLRPDDHHRIARTESTDHGRTWTEAVDTDLPNPHAAVDMVKLRDGRIALAYNDSPHVRTPLTLALSEDEGETWPHKRVLIHEPGREFHYPAIIEGTDGLLHVTYTNNRLWIGHFALSPDWIMNG